MLTPPNSLDQALLVKALGKAWQIDVRSIEYAPVGFGSHHWRVEGSGGRCFVTVDDLDDKLDERAATRAAALLRLRRALGTARSLAEHGLSFVVAPIPTAGGDVAVAVTDRFALSVYPYVDGNTFAWGDALPAGVMRALIGRITALHTMDVQAIVTPPIDDHSIPKRASVSALLGGAGFPTDSGPYAAATVALIVDHTAAIRSLFDRYDRMVDEIRMDHRPSVITHGEPHPGNVVVTAEGPLLVDWDTVMLAPPERDLSLMDRGDGSMIEEYTAATGLQPRPEVLDLYRTWWTLADIAAFVDVFRRPHDDDANNADSWHWLSHVVHHIAGGQR